MSTKHVCGIDLGTTYSCVGVFENDRVEIVANENGNRTTPSWVSFTEERLIGDAAKSLASKNPENTIYDVKRFMGQKFSENSKLDSFAKSLPYHVKNVNDKPVFEVTHRKEKKDMSAEQISAMVLEKMKITADSFVSAPVKDCVITVPAYFNDAQRQATKDAGVIAGLNVLRIINEPTAAAIAYGLDKVKTGEDKNILVFDFGGGTHDVSLLNISDGVFEVIATSGDTHLGGEDIDHVLIRYCISEFEKKHRPVKLTGNKRAFSRLHQACERAKRALSGSTTTLLEVDALVDGIDFSLSLTRAKMEDLCGEIFRKTMQPVYTVLKDAKLDKTKVDEIVLVGGSTRIPKVQSLLRDYFGKELNNSINPDECVAYGATIQAALLAGIESESTKDILLLDCTPLSLGIETSGEVMTVLIPRGTTIPAKKTQTFSTFANNQPSATIKVLEGERYSSKDNNTLGTFQLDNIPPAPRGTPKINVSYDINADGILNVSAEVENVPGGKKSLTINNDSRQLSDEDIAKMVAEAETFKKQDEELKENREAAVSYENMLFQNLNMAPKEDGVADEYKKLIQDELDWLQTVGPSTTKNEIENRKRDFTEVIKEKFPASANPTAAPPEGCYPMDKEMQNAFADKEMQESTTPTVEEVD